MFKTTWIAYSPSNANPTIGVEPSEESMRKDLETLTAAGFSGIITYGSGGRQGTLLPQLAQEMKLETHHGNLGFRK